MSKLCTRAITTALCGCLALAGCSAGTSSSSGSSAPDAQTSTSEQKNAQVVAGEWKPNTEPPSATLSAEQEVVFNKATEGVDDVSFGPVAVIGQQVVAGTNYAFLCQNRYWEGDATPEWTVVTIYNDLKGNAQVVEEKGLDVADVRTSDTDAGHETTGAWSAPAPQKEASLPDSAQKAFEAAAEARGDVSLTPIALLGTQGEPDTGVSYRFFAIEAPKGEERGTACVVDVHEDAIGAYTVTSSAPLDLAYYVTR